MKNYKTYSVCGSLPSVRVHAGHEVDPGGVDESSDVLVARQVLGAEVVRQMEQQLTTKHLVAMHVGNVLHLRLT